MHDRVNQSPRPKSTRHLLASTILLLSCLPLWGNDAEPPTHGSCRQAFNSTCLPHWGGGPEITVDEPRSTFRVVGGAASSVLTGSWRKPLVLRGHEGGVNAVALSANGRFAVSGGDDRTVRVWDATTGELLHTMEGHEDTVWDVAISADGRIAVSESSVPSYREPPESRGGTIRVWDATTGKLLHTMQDQDNSIRDMALSANGRIVATADSGFGFRGTVRFWDVAAGRLLHTMDAHYGFAGAVAINADGSIAVSGGANHKDDTVGVWDVAAGRRLHTMEDHRENVPNVALSANGRIALSGDVYGTVRVWDTTTGKLLRTMENRGGRGAVLLSTDGRLALSGGYGGTVRLSDVATGKLLQAMPSDEHGVYAAPLSADGRIALSQGRDGIARLWRFPLGDPQSMLGQAAEYYTEQGIEARAGPAIPEPELPRLRDWKDPFETMAMYQQRMATARAEHERQVKDIEARNRAAVEERDARVQSLGESQRREIRLTAHAKAVAELFGHPMLGVMRDEHGKPRHALQTNPPGMRIVLQFQHTRDFEDWLFKVPPGEPTTDLQAALEAGEVSATAEYRLEDDVPSLVVVYARHGDRKYKGIPAERDGYPASQGESDNAAVPP